jgi:nitrous oxidase accessory protein NosD
LETLVPVNGPFGAISSAVNAANADGGDIIILRPGNYNQTPTINKPLTLRATLDGFATIGSP